MTGGGKGGGNSFRASDNKLARGIKTESDHGHGKLRHKVECVNRGAGAPWCKCEETIGGPANLPPDVVEKKFRQKGWHHNRRGTWTCDPCVQEEKKVTTPKRDDLKGQVADPKLMRQLYAALDDAFDETVMRYRGNNTDETIAKAFGLSPMFVAKVRREAYGELAEDPELRVIRTQLAETEARLAATETKLLERAVELLAEPRRLLSDARAALEKLELKGVRR